MRTKLVTIALLVGLALGSTVAIAQPADAQVDPAEREQRREERLQMMIDEGLIDEERAEQIRERLAERAARLEERRAERQARIDEIAALVGLTGDELRDAIRSGSSLADLATAAGVDVSTIIDEIEAHKTAKIEEALAEGKIDQAQADERLGELRDRITARVNGERPDPQDRPGHGRGPGGLRGLGGSGAPSTTPGD